MPKSRTVNRELRRVAQERVEIEWVRGHRDGTVRVARPFLFRTIAVKLDSVLVWIVEIKCLTHSVITRAIERDLGREHSPERITERRAIGINDGHVK